MSQNFDNIFNEIKNTEETNHEVLENLKISLQEDLQLSRNTYNKKRETEILKINQDLELKYNQEQNSILENFSKKKIQINAEIDFLKSNFSENKSKAVKFLLDQLVN